MTSHKLSLLHQDTAIAIGSSDEEEDAPCPPARSNLVERLASGAQASGSDPQKDAERFKV